MTSLKTIILCLLLGLSLSAQPVSASANPTRSKPGKALSDIQITTADLFAKDGKANLEKSLKEHPDEEVVLTITEESVKAGMFTLHKNDIPSNLKHLVIRDPDNLVKNIGNNFLRRNSNIVTFKAIEFQSLKAISDGFLAVCMNLTHFDSSGFTALETIGREFLFACHGITHFDSSGFIAVKTIGDEFLDSCTALTHFDSSGFIVLETIGNDFLLGCTGLISFDSSGFKALKTIGNRFLFGRYS
ncbi:MAG TPA: hypothetical protein DD412_02480 [Holosporales bacterium]|nr:hypothetical protein [Holosporales bacterium]